jgi:hypothetical protein
LLGILVSVLRAAAQDSIVESFEQLDGHAASRFVATDLGFAISKCILARQRDRRWFDIRIRSVLPLAQTAGVNAWRRLI